MLRSYKTETKKPFNDFLKHRDQQLVTFGKPFAVNIAGFYRTKTTQFANICM